MGYEIDFLPVGGGRKQGDAIAVRFGDLTGPRRRQVVMVIDAGLEESGAKLVAHIREQYGTQRVDLVVCTHGHADHMDGLGAVLEGLRVDCLWMHLPDEHGAAMARIAAEPGDEVTRGRREPLLAETRRLAELARSKGVRIVEPFAGMEAFEGRVVVLGPSRDYYERLLPAFGVKAAPARAAGVLGRGLDWIRRGWGEVAERLGMETLREGGYGTAENNTSVVLLLRIEGQSLLFTSDAGVEALGQAAERMEAAGVEGRVVVFFKVPHHGGQAYLSPSVLDRLVGPRGSGRGVERSAFICAPADSGPGLVSPKVVNALGRRGLAVHFAQAEVVRFSPASPADAAIQTKLVDNPLKDPV